MKLFGSIALAAAMTVLSLPSTAAEYRLLSSWDKNYAYNPYLLDPFVERVAKATDGRVTISVFGPETVPPFEQVEPVGSGVFQFLFTHGAYHFGTSPMATAADALVGGPEEMRKTDVFKVIDEEYQKFGLKLVMLPITPQGAYNILLRAPVDDKGGLDGRKIRGTLSYSGVVKMLGGVLTVLPASEIYTGLEKGLVDGAAWPTIGALDYKWYEVAGYLLRPGFGANYEPIFMNLDAWNALSDADKQAIMDVSHQLEDEWYKEVPAVWQKEEDELVAKGMKITEMGAEQKAKLQDAWAEGLWKLAEEKDPVGTKKLRDAGIAGGMTK